MKLHSWFLPIATTSTMSSTSFAAPKTIVDLGNLRLPLFTGNGDNPIDNTKRKHRIVFSNQKIPKKNSQGTNLTERFITLFFHTCNRAPFEKEGEFKGLTGQQKRPTHWKSPALPILWPTSKFSKLIAWGNSKVMPLTSPQKKQDRWFGFCVHYPKLTARPHKWLFPI